MTHAWCRDVQRDEAVRAAEDNRQGPLPTLEEAISRAVQFMPTEAPQERKCTERESGLRTERVTLEVTVDPRRIFFPGQWQNALRQSGSLMPGESVRVVQAVELSSSLDTAIQGMERAQRERDDAISEYQSVAAERDAAIRERDKLRGEIGR